MKQKELSHLELAIANFEQIAANEAGLDADALSKAMGAAFEKFSKNPKTSLADKSAGLVEYPKIWFNTSVIKYTMVNLQGVNLERADLEEVELPGANLEGANLEWANLYETDLEGADLRGANLRGATLQNADLEGANLYEADLQRADLYEADLERANLRGANLQNADLEGAILQGANLPGANLNGADLEEADLEEANLLRANLLRANLRGANLTDTDFTNAIVIGSNFNNAEIWENGNRRPLTDDELDEKLKDAIRTPDDLLAHINSILSILELNPSQITEEQIKQLPNLYKTAADIGQNGAKQRQNNDYFGNAVLTDLCDQHAGLAEAAKQLQEKFPTLTKALPEQIEPHAKGILARIVVDAQNNPRTCEFGNTKNVNVTAFLQVVTFMQGFQNGLSGVLAKICAEVLAGTDTTYTKPDLFSSRIATNLASQGKVKSAQSAAAPANLLIESERSILNRIAAERTDAATAAESRKI